MTQNDGGDGDGGSERPPKLAGVLFIGLYLRRSDWVDGSTAEVFAGAGQAAVAGR